MSSARLVTLHFPDGNVQHEVGDSEPSVGKLYRRHGDLLMAVDATVNNNGSLDVLLVAHEDARAILRADLLDRAAEARATARETVVESVESRLTRGDGEHDRRAWNLPAAPR